MDILRRRFPRGLSIRFPAVLVAALVWVAPIGPAPLAEPSATTSGAGAATEVDDRGRAAVSLATGLAPRLAHSSRGRVGFADTRLWPGGVVTWNADVPRRYRWSVRHGVNAWNRTHSGVRFEWRPASEAALRIEVGRTGGASATATVGYQRRGENVVTIRRVAIDDWQDRQVYGRVVAHELGHVLGLQHTTGLRCGLMESTLRADCSRLPRRGTYACRWVGAAVGAAVVEHYGGTFERGPRRCALRDRSS